MTISSDSTQVRRSPSPHACASALRSRFLLAAIVLFMMALAAAALPWSASAQTPAVPSSDSLAARVLIVARGELGVVERPRGSNAGPRIRVYARSTGGVDGQPWCSMFASWAFARAGVPLGSFGAGFARVQDLRAWARAERTLLPLDTVPVPGDLVARGGEHIGIVERVEGRVATVISGNSSDRVQRTRHVLPQPWRVIRVRGDVLAPTPSTPSKPPASPGSPSAPAHPASPDGGAQAPGGASSEQPPEDPSGGVSAPER